MLAELLNKIDGCVLGTVSVHELEAWLVGHLQAILDSADPRTVTLANAVDADLVDLSEALLDHEEFFARLESYLREHRTVVLDLAKPEQWATKTGVESRSLESPVLSWRERPANTTIIIPDLQFAW